MNRSDSLRVRNLSTTRDPDAETSVPHQNTRIPDSHDTGSPVRDAMSSNPQSQKHIGNGNRSTDSHVLPDDLTDFWWDVLYVVAGEAQKGVDVQDKIDSYYEKRINHGRVYTTLNWLADRGLIAIGKIDARANQYSITDAGRQMLAAQREWQQMQLDRSGDNTSMEGCE